MALESVHPLYQARQPDWVTMRDLYAGETVVKEKGETYLPATKGMKLDGMQVGQIGYETYRSYLMRSVFPDYVRDAVEAYIGFMHQKSPTIELPTELEAMRQRATVNGEPLEMLLRRLNEEQLVTGRVGMLLDLPSAPFALAHPLPYIALYNAESIRNWDDATVEGSEAKLNLVVLDESGFKRTLFEWNAVTRYRVLQLGNLAENEAPGATARYLNGSFEADGAGASPVFVESDMKMPVYRGTPLEQIPFVFVNTKDIVPDPDLPPLLGLGRLALAIYRGEADYRQNLFMQGQDTFVTIGDFQRKAETDPNALKPDADAEGVRTGAGSRVAMELGGDAKYVGVNGGGLSEQREALTNDRKRAESRSGQLIDARKSGDTESGEALKTRVAAQTATLNQIAKTGASALEAMLKMAAEWIGADAEKVKVSPNLEFADFEMSGKNLADMMDARAKGAPISLRSIHDLMADQGLTRMDYDTENKLLAVEDQELKARGLLPEPKASDKPTKPVAAT